MLLNTKIQHNNFEPGEYVDIKPRTFEETIACINAFPWEKERDHIIISLTNPSITIEKDINCFLKFALYYNGKFVLHYFDDEQNLYTKSFFNKEDSFSYIKAFFDEEVYDLTDFKKEPTWMQSNLIHFVTLDFHYTVTPKRIREFLLKSSGINFAASIIFLCFLLFNNKPLHLIPLIIGISVFFLLYGGGLNLIIFLNYYFSSKNKMLYMTKGDDIFYFGEKQNPVKYDKKNIREIIIYSPVNIRNPVGFFSVVKIIFITGEVIQIPNLLISESSLAIKLYKCHIINKSRLKFISTSFDQNVNQMDPNSIMEINNLEVRRKIKSY